MDRTIAAEMASQMLAAYAKAFPGVKVVVVSGVLGIDVFRPDPAESPSESPSETGNCPDCAATAGMPHDDGCDVARCTTCGFQRIGCSCPNGVGWGQVWTGRWPGLADVEALGLSDLNELGALATDGTLCWNQSDQRWERP
jgi:hypothetical protein